MLIRTTITETLNFKDQLKSSFKSLVAVFVLIILGVTVTNTIAKDVSQYIWGTIMILVFYLLFKLSNLSINSKKTKEIGELIITPENLKVTINDRSQIYTINTIVHLKVYYYGYDGLTMGRYVDNGDFNRISFENSGTKINLQFYLDSKNRIDDLKEIYQKWYDNRINFKEFTMGKRSFLFEGNLSYERIQKLKAEYQIDWI